MNISTKMIVSLTVVTVLAGLALAFCYEIFKDKIDQNAVKALNDSINEVIPGAVSKEDISKDGMVMYKVYDKPLSDDTKNFLGYAIVINAGGYQGTIKLIVSVPPDFSKIITFRVLEHSETPGLGANITLNIFISQFENLPLNQPIKVKKGVANKDTNEISAISGATISSKAVANGLNEGLAKAKTLILGSNQ